MSLQAHSYYNQYHQRIQYSGFPQLQHKHSPSLVTIRNNKLGYHDVLSSNNIMYELPRSDKLKYFARQWYHFHTQHDSVISLFDIDNTRTRHYKLLSITPTHVILTPS